MTSPTIINKAGTGKLNLVICNEMQLQKLKINNSLENYVYLV